MKKLLIVLGVLALLAAAACAYWFGYQWFLEQSWRRVAEGIEADYPYLDVVTVAYVPARQWTVHVDPVTREAGITKTRRLPYVLIAFELVTDEVPDDAETVALFNDLAARAKEIAGRNTKLVAIVISDAGRGYVANALVELHTAVTLKDQAQLQVVPLWGRAYPEGLVLFPGRADDP